jgi:hypothetical protein
MLILLGCEMIHGEFDRYANNKVQVGELPNWMHISGKVAWYVFQGPYSGLSQGWREFMRKLHELDTANLAGPPGDVYVCDPQDHQGAEHRIITILWTPLKG